MNKLVKKKFKVENLNCGSCCMLIDSELETLDGVESARTSYVKCECEVEYDPNIIDERKITDEIIKLGYSSIPL